jgi:1,2-phenylacetyl-CoA epoxidase catalytic subunit
MESREFVAALVAEMQGIFGHLGEHETLEAEAKGDLEVVTLLKLGMTSEIEASEIAALWMPSTPEVDAKILLAQQCADEMRHYQLIGQRLEELGEDLRGFDALADGYSPLYNYLRDLPTTLERIAAGPFAHEAIAEIRNAQFITFCRSAGDEGTARLYEEIILPEEVHHHRMGRDYLERYAVTPEEQERTASAARTTLAIADELQSLAEKFTGLHHIPVS